ncbi:MAG: hypothetical protein ACRYG8_04120 [Janthinobacterium lividum]
MLELIHGREAKGFHLSITVSDLRCSVTVEDIEGRGGRTVGECDSFAEAWFNQKPGWAR